MPDFVEIAVNVPQVQGVFHYHLPEELQDFVKVGHLVEVPFAHQRVQGIVIRFVSRPDVPETRPVLALIAPDTLLTPQQIELAGEISRSTLSTYAACIELMIPPGLGQQADLLYRLGEQKPGSSTRPPTDLQRRIIELLHRRGPLRARQIDHALPRVNWRASARSLIEKGHIETQSVLPEPRVQPKLVRTVRLAVSPESAEEEMESLGRSGSRVTLRRQAIMHFLIREPGPVNVSWVYAESGGNISDLHYLAEHDLVVLGESEDLRDPLAEIEFVASEPPQLTHAQETVWREIRAGIQESLEGRTSLPYLLHGVTGSGKTEIYLRAVEDVLQLGKQAIVLVPEIALTPQTVRRFIARFPGRVGLTHSGLSSGERFDTWRRAREGKVSIVVGPRSALFTPFPNLGLIVVDEAHDDSYYQSETPPHYHAREVSISYARLTGAICILGSATPDIVTRYRAEKGHFHYLQLPARILAHRQSIQAQIKKLKIHPGKRPARYHHLEAQAESADLPEVEIVDMRDELKTGNRSIFSRPLQTALADVLSMGEQAILFLNRRGTATYVFCRSCGYSVKCPRCDFPLTYHTPRPILTCHHCGYERKLPETCPQCGSKHIRHYGTGTERVESEAQEMFPQASTLRWDYDTTRAKGAHDIIMSHFANQRANILIGTQMIAKGLDLPLVTLVGVILADVGLNLPDLRASERTFQVLTQVAGRAGRSPLGGRVFLQTFHPDHYVIQTAAGHDYQSFYTTELGHRRRLGYPPFSRLVRLVYRHADSGKAEEMAHLLASEIRDWIVQEKRRATQLIGPVPCFYARLGGLYRWQIIVRGPDPVSLLRGRNLGDWSIEVDPPSLL
jgi:primosomal protein N' (replication factor Y) (superfamily II helicase)